MIRTRSLLVTFAISVALTILFWWPLYAGAGFVGGDLYPYFFPQKAFYCDRLRAGEFPLWNDLVGFGYPVLGESQTGAAYPFHFLFYSCFDLNTAYNVEHLLHYIICFVGTWLFAKRLGLADLGAWLAALVFTYGWFPPRACLEWAILTGAWLPVMLWCVESFLQTRWWRYAIGLSFAHGLQLLAGHYHLAFISQLVVASYVCVRLWIEQRQKKSGPCSIDFIGQPVTPDRLQKSKQTKGAVVAYDEFTSRCGTRAAIALMLAGVAAGGLAAVQLLPTMELKSRSSRVVTGGDYDPAYGHMPPLYTSQLIAPWLWYNPQEIDEINLVRDVAEFLAPWHWFGPQQQLDQSLQQSRFGAVSAGTNKVEAHAYCGQLPILMALVAVIIWIRNRRNSIASESMHNLMHATTGFWIIAGGLALIYATGCLLPIGRHLPGFGFFRGSGRYGIVTTLVIALLAGQTLTFLGQRVSTGFIYRFILVAIFASTCGDLWLVSRMVKYTYMVRPPISFRDASDVRRLLLAESQPPRLLAPGPNVVSMLGVSSVPWYLGIAPAEYVNPQLGMPPIPKPLVSGKPTPGSPELNEWLGRSGVTHVLNFEPLEEKSWQVELVWKGVDPFLNRVWGRQEPIYLYRFRDQELNGVRFPGRAYAADQSTSVAIPDQETSDSGSRRLNLTGEVTGDVILTELAYPGWNVELNGKPIDSKQVGIFRSVNVAGDHGEVIWTYRPQSVYYGVLISLLTLIVLATIAHIKFWHPKFVDRILSREPRNQKIPS